MRITAFITAAALTCAAYAGAKPLFVEDFSYPAGAPLAGLDGGNGFSGGWYSRTEAAVTGKTFDYPVAGGGVVAGGSAGLSVTVEPGKTIPAAIYRSLGETFDGDEVYVSFLLRQTQGSVTNNDRFNFWLGNKPASSGPYGGLLRAPGSSFYVRPNGLARAATVKSAFAVDRTYFIVLRFTKSTTGKHSSYDVASIWINPSANSEAKPSGTSQPSETSISISSFSMVGVEVINASPSVANTYYFDQLQAGAKWADVVPTAPAE